ncbi:MAG: hypothetical protein J6I53_09995 [Treponema sp.]|uniref:hypothetical protein n=1 Tax=Treponema sp. TaxID=166 RepID=UPI001B53F890|nr:hypothetical protein [Treponema sp.]MBP3773000.1 hypothetical protein [Treponema sp.]MBQ9281635.1 hypothetical protein [Treponema sp.]
MDFDELKESISDLTREKPFLFAFIGIIVFLFIAGLVILMIQTTPVKKTEMQAPEPFTQDSPILTPDSLDIEKEYYPTRIPENQWSKEDINTWFTYPEEETMAELEKANDKTVEGIIGAAP